MWVSPAPESVGAESASSSASFAAESANDLEDDDDFAALFDLGTVERGLLDAPLLLLPDDLIDFSPSPLASELDDFFFVVVVVVVDDNVVVPPSDSLSFTPESV